LWSNFPKGTFSVPSWEATDFSEKMIEEAKVRTSNLPVTFTVQDATNLPYEDGRFDTVVIANALHNYA